MRVKYLRHSHVYKTLHPAHTGCVSSMQRSTSCNAMSWKPLLSIEAFTQTAAHCVCEYLNWQQWFPRHCVAWRAASRRLCGRGVTTCFKEIRWSNLHRMLFCGKKVDKTSSKFCINQCKPHCHFCLFLWMPPLFTGSTLNNRWERKCSCVQSKRKRASHFLLALLGACFSPPKKKTKKHNIFLLLGKKNTFCHSTHT